MYSEKDTKRLLELIGEGDSKAFEQLFNLYWEPLFAAAMHRLRSRELSKDVLQELFVDLWEKRKVLDIRTNIRGYLFTALKHRIINQIKSEAVRENYERMTIQFYETNSLATDHQISRNDLETEIGKQMKRLPNRCREVFELSRIEHMSHREISERLNISPKTVENHIGRALKILRTYLKQIVCISLIIFAGYSLLS